MTSRLIAQMKAASSRAIAVAMMFGRLPFRVSERKRPHNLICAFQAISRTALGAAATLFCFSRLTRGGYPPSTSEGATANEGAPETGGVTGKEGAPTVKGVTSKEGVTQEGGAPEVE